MIKVFPFYSGPDDHPWHTGRESASDGSAVEEDWEDDGREFQSRPSELSPSDRNYAVFCHLSGLALFTGIPFGNLLLPLVLWAARRDESWFIDEHGKEAINFQISVTIYLLLSALLVCLLVGIPLLIFVLIFNVVCMIMAAVNVSGPEFYRYPMTIRLLR